MKFIILWLDALSPEKITPEITPFIYQLTKKYSFGIHKPVFGYSSVGAAFFSGLLPKESNQLYLYWKRKKFGNWLISFLPKKIASFAWLLKRFVMKKTFLARLIDKRILSLFSLSQDHYYHHPNCFPRKTIFGYILEKKLSYFDYNWPYQVINGCLKYTLFDKNNDQSAVEKFLKIAEKGNFNWLFFHLYELDKIGHKFGPDSREFKNHLRKVDSFVKVIFEKIITEKDLFLLWSDHGMLPVKRSIDIEKEISMYEKLSYFLDSTTARFWFSNKLVKEKVLKKISDLNCGQWISEKEAKRLSIDFSHSYYGESLFVINPGTIISPNFFQKDLVKGMHGYGSNLGEEKGFYLTNIRGGLKRELSTEKLFKIMLGGLNLFKSGNNS